MKVKSKIVCILTIAILLLGTSCQKQNENKNLINLSEYDEDYTITESGSYTLNGTLNHSLIIDVKNGEVQLILNNAEISSQSKAAIIGLQAGKITITLAADSINTLSDGGNSDYDGCIYSNSELVFNGEGKLIIYGNQQEGEGIATEAQNITFNGGTYEITSADDGINAGGDGATVTVNDGMFYINAAGDGIDSNKNAVINGGVIFVIGSDNGGDSGIDTDEGYVINGGTVVALGSDMIETPLETSTQKTLAFVLKDKISADTTVTLMKVEDVIVSFSAPKSFKNVIISSDKLIDGEYSLYVGGENTGTLVYGIYSEGQYSKGELLSIDGQSLFAINSTVNLYGQSNNQMPVQDDNKPQPSENNSGISDRSNGQKEPNDSFQPVQDLPQPPQGNQSDKLQMDNERNFSVPIQYLAGAIVTSLIIAYLFISKFLKRSFKEAFCNRDKVLIYILTVIILSEILAFSAVKLIGKETGANDISSTEYQNNTSIEYNSSQEITEDTTFVSGTLVSKKCGKNRNI